MSPNFPESLICAITLTGFEKKNSHFYFDLQLTNYWLLDNLQTYKKHAQQSLLKIYIKSIIVKNEAKTRIKIKVPSTLKLEVKEN